MTKVTIDIFTLLKQSLGTAPTPAPAIEDLCKRLETHGIVDLQLDIHDLMAKQRMIADIWSIEDVQSQCERLTDDEAWSVLQRVERRFDAGVGINWEVIDLIADEMYPDETEGELS